MVDDEVTFHLICLIQLIFTRLERKMKLCSGVGTKAKEYFARANEIRFSPKLDALGDCFNLDIFNKSNWSAMKFFIQVINYSDISEGMVFEIDFEGWEKARVLSNLL